MPSFGTCCQLGFFVYLWKREVCCFVEVIVHNVEVVVHNY